MHRARHDLGNSENAISTSIFRLFSVILLCYSLGSFFVIFKLYFALIILLLPPLPLVFRSKRQ